MSYEESIRNFVFRVQKIKENINTEEATKTSLIMPFFQLLGYDVFNPNEFVPEYVADVGIKKGEKVDYAIILDDKVTILIEAKSINEQLQKHDSQLFRYFGTSSAKFAILTNGVVYRFYTDLEETNKMDSSPFLEINLLDLKDSDMLELKKFQKENFDINSIVSTASDLKYLGQIKKVLKEEFNEPTDEFVRMILNKDIYEGVKTQSVVEKYRPILKKSVNYYINELINERLQNAILKTNDNVEASDIYEEKENDIETTVSELETFYIIKSILAEKIDINRISYKDTYSYFGILLDGKVTKWVCRIYLKDNVKYIIIPNGEKQEIRFNISNTSDIYRYKNELIERIDSFSIKVIS
jgi:hypothetical protein